MIHYLQRPARKDCPTRLFWRGLPLPMFTEEEADKLAKANAAPTSDFIRADDPDDEDDV